MPKCVMLDKGITYRPGGKLYPCCLWEWGDDQKDITSYTEFRQVMDKKKIGMEGDNWIPECDHCRQDEKYKGESFRDHANNIVEGGFWEMNFNNTCNLACRMCNGSLSSTWASLVKQNKDLDWHTDYKDISYQDHLKYDKIEFYHELPEVRHIKLLGGEPMLMKEVYRMLDYVMESGHAKNINLHLTTNLTQPFNEYWLNVISKFKKVQVMGSVDGLGTRYNYIRPNSNWDDVLENAKKVRDLQEKYKNLTLSISSVGQTLTAVQHWDIFKFWEGIGIPKIDIEQVYEPHFMSYRSLHPTLRKKFNVNAGFEYDPKQWDMLLKQMAILDKLHGTDFKTECPELFDVL